MVAIICLIISFAPAGQEMVNVIFSYQAVVPLGQTPAYSCGSEEHLAGNPVTRALVRSGGP